MSKNPARSIGSLVVMCFICIFFVTRTEGFESIRTVQFLLIFIAGVTLGVAIGLIRGARRKPEVI